MASMRLRSREEWEGGANNADVNAGGFQRIADALEKMALNYGQLIADRDRFERWYNNECGSNALLRKRISGLRGYMKRIKRGKG